MPSPLTSAPSGAKPGRVRQTDFGGDFIQVVVVHRAIARDVAEQPVEVVHGGRSTRKLDIELVIAIGGRRVGAAAQAVCTEVELDRVVDDRDVHPRERDGRLARRVVVQVVLVELDLG